jgi:hypothetical protein
MEKEQRSKLQKTTQDARRLLEEEFSRQLLETYDINVAAGRWSQEPGAHLQAEQRLLREKLLAWIKHRSVQIKHEKEALLLALREMAFTALNRFVALKLMEARELVRPCVSGGLESEGFQEFTAVAQGLLVDQESSYRLYLETIFEDVSRELRALFDPRDPASLLWPKRTALLDLLDILNRPELAELWREDETLGWIYQYFNGDTERKKMREESAAPRNSRELAVRNQFFTPRYVVEFLTDNTLGRIWYEMRQGDTGLKERCRYLVRRPNEIWLQPGEEAPAEVVADEALSQEELLRQPVYIPHRPLKDPREIRMLDPACGSMHFGLYAFDLYLAIYEEAWEIAQGSDEQAKQGEAFAPFVTYAADFASKAAFLREVPRLILLHNIHGVDIDPRATQIARLTLWLRAQRAWKEQGVEVAARPAITRSNVVCAEPMPGEKELLADFVDQQFPEAERGFVQRLLEVIFDKMQLAGEAGSLLKIEEEIRDAIDQARREWQKLAIQQRDLFSAAELAALGGVGSALNTDLQNLTRDFWVTIEERIYDALRDYANQAESGGYQRRLFAEDAAQGFAFIDICRKRYDAVEMNPPFGEPSRHSKNYISTAYPRTKNDVYAAFVERWLGELSPRGMLGAITSRTGFFLSAFQKWREQVLLHSAPPLVFADLGYGVLDSAMVETAAYCLQIGSDLDATFFRLISSDTKEEDLAQEITSLRCQPEQAKTSFSVKPNAFTRVPSSPFAYWVGEAIRGLFLSQQRLSDVFFIDMGMSTKNDERFVVLRWEVPPASIGWENKFRFYAKGGDSSSEGLVVDTLVLSEQNFDQLKAELVSKYPYLNGDTDWILHPEYHYGKAGLTFGRRVRRFRPIPIPEGIMFSDSNPSIFSKHDPAIDWVGAYLSSRVMQSLLGLMTPPRKIEVGYVAALPVPKHFSDSAISQLRDFSSRLYRRSQRCSEHFETDPRFTTLSEFQASSSMLDHIDASQEEDEIDAIVSDVLGISDADKTTLLKEIHNTTGLAEFDENFSATADAGSGETNTDLRQSYLFGCAFGRWDIRFAIGEQAPPELLDPFAPLPVCPSGQLQNAQGLPASQEDVPSSYPVRIPWDGILVDDPNHPLDLECRVREVIEIIWSGKDGGATAEAIEHEACDILGVKTLRDYFRKPSGFFADHLKRYSKSRRQAPIYWQLAAGNGNYSAWLYYHRFTQDTLYRLLRDFVGPRIQEAELEQFELESQGGLSGDAASLFHEVQALLQDLRLFKSELELVAPLWNPNLNDGVIINHAILWRITPYTPWQKKCKECWDKLVKGDYDWAHLAFYLWPERVIRKCTTDRSLAIAHGLEERLWQETNNGNWLQRQLPDAELQALLAEYSKPAVQNALERFLAASPPVAAARTRAPRAAKASSTGTTRRPRGSAPEVDAETSRQTLLVLTAAPTDGLGRNAIAELLGVEAASLTAVIKQLKEGGQIEQLGAARGAKYRLTESGLAAVESQAGEGE